MGLLTALFRLVAAAVVAMALLALSPAAMPHVAAQAVGRPVAAPLAQ